MGMGELGRQESRKKNTGHAPLPMTDNWGGIWKPGSQEVEWGGIEKGRKAAKEKQNGRSQNTLFLLS